MRAKISKIHQVAMVHRLAIVLLLIVLIGSVLAGCGSSTGTSSSSSPTSSSGSSSIAAAQALLDVYTPPVTQFGAQGETPWPLDSVPAATNKTVGFVSCSQGAEGCRRQGVGVAEAGKVLGWNTIILDGKGSARDQTSAMTALVSRGVDAIVLGAVNENAVGPGMDAAKKAGIPVIDCTGGTVPGFLGSVGPDDAAAGKVGAAYMAVNIGPDAKVAMFINTEDPVFGTARNDGFKKGLKEFAPNAKILVEQSVSIAQIGPAEQQMMAAFLQAHPKGTVDYVWASFDAMLAPLVQAIQIAGRTEIKAMAVDGNQQNLEWIKANNVEVATAAYPLEWIGWQAMDELNRVFNGKPVLQPMLSPFRVLTSDTVPATGAYQGDYDFRSAYKQIWGK